jgi:S-adenosylmethionine:tRNA ribosyltransferase-isomerase
LLAGSKRLRTGERLVVKDAQDSSVSLELLDRLGEGQWDVRVNPPQSYSTVLERIGRTPLPPYIRRDASSTTSESVDRTRFPTVYARVDGSAAAPTAGLHFTRPLLEQIRAAGIEITFLTLHIGLGTFRPISAPTLPEHKMHEEHFEISAATAEAVHRTRARGSRVVAVGTTTVRALESAAEFHAGEWIIRPTAGTTDLFIRPPHSFRITDAMLTNFHLPKSTLLALVMAFAGVETIRRAYQHAVEAQYRFYSYGDAMFLASRCSP